MRVHFYYESKREAPEILTARKAAIGLCIIQQLCIIIFWKELEYPREKRNKKRKKKPSYEENPGYPFSEKLPNISLGCDFFERRGQKRINIRGFFVLLCSLRRFFFGWVSIFPKWNVIFVFFDHIGIDIKSDYEIYTFMRFMSMCAYIPKFQNLYYARIDMKRIHRGKVRTWNSSDTLPPSCSELKIGTKGTTNADYITHLLVFQLCRPSPYLMLY